MTDNDRKLSAFGELPRDVAPARDLWPGIATAIGAATAPVGAQTRADAPAGPASAPVTRLRRSFAAIHPAWAIAAAVGCVAVGVWIGRATLPQAPTLAATLAQAVSYVPDARFERTRETLLRDVSVRLAQLRPETRAKVEASLTTVQRARTDIETALGRDPANALLQEMLVNSYQDEMRLLTTVRESWVNGQEIGT